MRLRFACRLAATSRMLCVWFGLTLLTACGSTPQSSVIEYFDEDTVTAVTHSEQPALFVARRPSLSAMGGDMISLGPVSTILSTDHNQYLWMGFWTTVDRFRLQAPPPTPPDTIQIKADGEVFELVAVRNFPAADSRRRVYDAPAPGVQDAWYEVTREQLARMALAGELTVHTRSEDGTLSVYKARQDARPILTAFIEHTG